MAFCRVVNRIIFWGPNAGVAGKQGCFSYFPIEASEGRFRVTNVTRKRRAEAPTTPRLHVSLTDLAVSSSIPSWPRSHQVPVKCP